MFVWSLLVILPFQMPIVNIFLSPHQVPAIAQALKPYESSVRERSVYSKTSSPRTPVSILFFKGQRPLQAIYGMRHYQYGQRILPCPKYCALNPFRLVLGCWDEPCVLLQQEYLPDIKTVLITSSVRPVAVIFFVQFYFCFVLLCVRSPLLVLPAPLSPLQVFFLHPSPWPNPIFSEMLGLIWLWL